MKESWLSLPYHLGKHLTFKPLSVFFPSGASFLSLLNNFVVGFFSSNFLESILLFFVCFYFILTEFI